MMRAAIADRVEDAVEIEERDLLAVGIDGLAGIGRENDFSEEHIN